MKNIQHQNWFLVVFEHNIVPVVWMSVAVALACVVATFFSDNIYSASAELTLDASIDHLLPDIKGGKPSTKTTDFIRQEYFAINAVNLMQQPVIGDSVIRVLGVTDRSGKKLKAHNFINPSFFDLLFTNNGQGVEVKWISDTQQFSITGYGKDVEAAALLASRYTEAFLNYERQQFVHQLENLKEGKQVNLKTALDRRAGVDDEMSAVRGTYKVADWSGRLGSMTSSLAIVEQQIEEEERASATLEQRLQEYERQITELKVPVHLTESEKKNQNIELLQNSLVTLAQQLASAAVEYTSEHPEYKKIKGQIDELRRQLVTESKKEYSNTLHNTSSALDSVLTNLMTERVNKVIRAGRLEQLRATRELYIREMERIAKGSALYSNLEAEKTQLTITALSEQMDILAIDAILAKPFSFYRISAVPFIDKENVGYFRFFPKKKLILLFAMLSTAFLTLSYVFFRELHIETLYRAWQCTNLPSSVLAIDVIPEEPLKGILLARYLAARQPQSSILIRVRQFGEGVNARQMASVAADQFVCSGMTVLLVDMGSPSGLDLEDVGGSDFRAWLAGQVNDPAACEYTHSSGYKVLDGSCYSAEIPYVRTIEEVRALFVSLRTRYQVVVCVDQPILGASAPLLLDVGAGDVDVFVVQSGTMAVAHVENIVTLEMKIGRSGQAVLVVANDRDPIDMFSFSGFVTLIHRLISLPVRLFSRRNR